MTTAAESLAANMNATMSLLEKLRAGGLLPGGVNVDLSSLDGMTSKEIADILKSSEGEIISRLEEIKNMLKSDRNLTEPMEEIIVSDCNAYDSNLQACTPGENCPPPGAMGSGIVEVDVKTGAKRVCLTEDQLTKGASLAFDNDARKRFETALQRHAAVTKRLLVASHNVRQALDQASQSKATAEGAKNLANFGVDVTNMMQIGSGFFENSKQRVRAPTTIVGSSGKGGTAPTYTTSSDTKTDIPLGFCETATNAFQCDAKRSVTGGGGTVCTWTPDLLVYQGFEKVPAIEAIHGGTGNGLLDDVGLGMRTDHTDQNRYKDLDIAEFVDPYEVQVTSKDGKAIAVRADAKNARAMARLDRAMNNLTAKCMPNKYLPYMRTTKDEHPMIAKALIENTLLQSDALEPKNKGKKLDSYLKLGEAADEKSQGALGLLNQKEFQRIVNREKYFMDPTRPSPGAIKAHPDVHVAWAIILGEGRRAIAQADHDDRRLDKLRSAVKLCLKELNHAKVAFEKKTNIPADLAIKYRKEDKEQRKKGAYTVNMKDGAGAERANRFWRALATEDSMYDARMSIYSTLGILLTTLFDLEMDNFDDADVMTILSYEDQIVRAITNHPGGKCSLASVFDESSSTPIYYQLPRNKGKGQEVVRRISRGAGDDRVPIQHYVVMTKDMSQRMGLGPFATYTDARGNYSGVVPLVDDKVLSAGSCVMLTGMLSEMFARHPRFKYDGVLSKYARAMYGSELDNELKNKYLNQAVSIIGRLGDAELVSETNNLEIVKAQHVLAESVNSRFRSFRSKRVSSRAGSLHVSTAAMHLILNLAHNDDQLIKTTNINVSNLRTFFTTTAAQLQEALGGTLGLEVQTTTTQPPAIDLDLVKRFEVALLLPAKNGNLNAYRDLEQISMDSVMGDGFIPSITELMVRSLRPFPSQPDVFDQVIPISRTWLTEGFNDEGPKEAVTGTGTARAGVTDYKAFRLYYAALLATVLPKRMGSIGPGGIRELCKLLKDMGWYHAMDSVIMRLALVKDPQDAKGDGAYKYVYWNDFRGSNAILNQRLNKEAQAALRSDLNAVKNGAPAAGIMGAVLNRVATAARGVAGKAFGSTKRGMLRESSSSYGRQVGEASRETLNPEGEVGSIVLDSVFANEILNPANASKIADASRIAESVRGALPFLQIAQAENGRAAMFNHYTQFQETPRAYDKTDTSARGTFRSTPKDIRVGYLSLYREKNHGIADEESGTKESRKLGDTGLIPEDDPAFNDKLVTDLWYDVIEALALTHDIDTTTAAADRWDTLKADGTTQTVYQGTSEWNIRANAYFMQLETYGITVEDETKNNMLKGAKAARYSFIERITGMGKELAMDFETVAVVDFKAIMADMMTNLFADTPEDVQDGGTIANTPCATTDLQDYLETFFDGTGTGTPKVFRMTKGRERNNAELNKSKLPAQIAAAVDSVRISHALEFKAPQKLPMFTDAPSLPCQLAPTLGSFSADTEPIALIQPMGYDIAGFNKSLSSTTAGRNKKDQFTAGTTAEKVGYEKASDEYELRPARGMSTGSKRFPSGDELYEAQFDATGKKITDAQIGNRQVAITPPNGVDGNVKRRQYAIKAAVNYTRDCPRVLYTEANGRLHNFSGLIYDVAQPSHYMVHAYTRLLEKNAFGPSTSPVLSSGQLVKLLQCLIPDARRAGRKLDNVLDARLQYGLLLHFLMARFISTAQNRAQSRIVTNWNGIIKTIATREVLNRALKDALANRARSGSREVIERITGALKKLIVESKQVALALPSSIAAFDNDVRVSAYVA